MNDTPTAPRLLRTPDELRAARARLTGRTALVPTMGALHEGHLALVDRARQVADHVIVSDFVNPLQFGPGEDFEAYPRDLEGDLRLLAGRADAVFAPEVAQMYPLLPPTVTVDPGVLGTVLEGRTRPGHFAGVATVVLKLLQLVRPEVAVFGAKDAQQLALVRRLVADLDVPVAIEAVPIQREGSGLARSSRNAYLTPAQRESALVLSRTIRAVERAAPSSRAVRDALDAALSAPAPGVQWDYALAVDPATFAPITAEHRGTVQVVLAARVGRPRLLDATTLEITAP